MATRQVKVAPQTPDAIQMPDGWQMVANPQTEPDDEDVEMSPADRVAEMLRAGKDSDRASVKLYRMGSKGEEFCSEYSPEDFETIGFDGIREKWGSGQYIIRLYGTVAGSNRFTRRASTHVTIAEVKTPNPVIAQSNDLTRAFEAMQRNQEMILRALTEKPPAPDPMSEMTKMLSMMTMMREAMGLNAQPQQKSSIGEIVDAIKELRSASSLIEGKEEKEPDSLLSMLPQVLDTIKTGMSHQAAPQPAPSIQFPTVSMPASIAAVPASTEEPIQESTDMINPMAVTRLLKDKAHIEKMIAEKTPSLDAANWIIENASDELVSVLVTDEWFDALVTVMPGAKEHEVWLKETREHTMQMLKDDGFFGEVEGVATPE